MTKPQPLGPSLYTLDPECQLPPRLIQLFLRSAPAQLQDLVDACAARDMQSARARAHKLKGGLYAAGATRLAEDVEALRVVLAANDWPAVEGLMPSIRREFAGVTSQLEAQLAGAEA